jgi:hypothetical protein
VALPSWLVKLALPPVLLDLPPLLPLATCRISLCFVAGKTMQARNGSVCQRSNAGARLPDKSKATVTLL